MHVSREWSLQPVRPPEGHLLHELAIFARDYEAAPLERSFVAAMDLLGSWLHADYVCIHFEGLGALDDAIQAECLRQCAGVLVEGARRLERELSESSCDAQTPIARALPRGPFRGALAIPLRYAGQRYAVVNAFYAHQQKGINSHTFDAISFLGHYLWSGVKRRLALRDGEEYDRLITLLNSLMESRDPNAATHAQRTMRYAEALALAAGVNAETLRVVQRAAALHDVGKIAISGVEERKHPELGEKLLRKLPGSHMAAVARAVGAHHERFDGSGYPRGLAGKEILLAARIIAVCDGYDAMTSGDPPRKAMSRQAALLELITNAGTQFDPDLVEAFVRASCWRVL